MRSRLDYKEKELESAQRERDAARANASGHEGGGAEDSTPGDDGDVAELETEVRSAIVKLEGVFRSRQLSPSCSPLRLDKLVRTEYLAVCRARTAFLGSRPFSAQASLSLSSTFQVLQSSVFQPFSTSCKSRPIL